MGAKTGLQGLNSFIASNVWRSIRASRRINSERVWQTQRINAKFTPLSVIPRGTHNCIPIRIHHMTSVVRWLRRSHENERDAGSNTARAACIFSGGNRKSTLYMYQVLIIR